MKFHAAALVSFALALVFYLISWIPALWVIAVIGVLFEVSAWLLVRVGPDEPYEAPRRR